MKKQLQLLTFISIISLVGGSGLFWIAENSSNPTVNDLFDTFYWWMVTSTTLGYGDIVAHTTEGRIVTIFVTGIGIFLYVNIVTLTTDALLHVMDRKQKGTAQIKCTGHIVLCEYTAFADEFIQSLPTMDEHAGKDIVIVSDLVERNPYPQHEFVCGVPINPSFLQLANVRHADCVFIFANYRFSRPDIKTLHIAYRIRKLNPQATLYAEILEPESDLLTHAPDGLIVLPSKTMTALILSDKPIIPAAFVHAQAPADG